MKKAFPLIPTDREAYCSLLPAIVKSLGVDIRTIEPPSRIKEFNTNLETLSTSVAKMSFLAEMRKRIILIIIE